jgi:hypothetical protein
MRVTPIPVSRGLVALHVGMKGVVCYGGHFSAKCGDGAVQIVGMTRYKAVKLCCFSQTFSLPRTNFMLSHSTFHAIAWKKITTFYLTVSSYSIIIKNLFTVSIYRCLLFAKEIEHSFPLFLLCFSLLCRCFWCRRLRLLRSS